MKAVKTIVVAVAALGLLLNTGVVTAQQATTPDPTRKDITQREASSAGMRADIFRASKLIGADVENPQGEDLGKIEDVVIDPQDGSVAYAVLSFGGFLGLGEKYYAIPWKALNPKAGDAEEFILNIDKERLENAQGFDKNNWPNMADRRWGQDIHAYYGQQPYWERREELRQDAKQHLTSPSTSQERERQQQARMRDDEKAGQAAMGQRHTLNATVQSVSGDTGRLTLQTTDGSTVELKASEQLAGSLQEGDSVEVVIRKMQGTDAQGKEKSQ